MYSLFSFTELFLRSRDSAHLDPIQTLSFSQRSDAYRRCLCSFSGSCRKDFEELFDVIITNALKPGFFSLVPQQRPFRTLGECQPDGLKHDVWGQDDPHVPILSSLTFFFLSLFLTFCHVGSTKISIWSSSGCRKDRPLPLLCNLQMLLFIQ